MSKIKKFGTFAGVYIPSLLTILGVIMYMRLGWVVGEAGLISTLIIIGIAHIISISTGLSISSVATDKTIKTGGIYYLLSRSLGLPMGGAIGITLFTGTALSISLYLVGFAESFLSVDVIRNFLHLEADVNGYRIVGTVAILCLVTIAFISTTLAIKTQFYILGAILLSLISIGIGFFTNSHLAPDSVLISPSGHNLSFETLFAIFFPAVTGFTAGVAMSGDLKDSKKSIPLGTMGSILTGLVIYAGLAIFLAFFVNRELLLNNYAFLLEVAWFSPVVLAGIWGATLSSALGGILGGPRILQAISQDKITPKIFAKGHGEANDPRNALILIFVIAEAGVLLGQLDLIAGVVSMFYLASYGFINIAFFLESWASTDFRPTFKISKYTGLIGFIASFGVMFKLDMMSMIAALVIMLGIYFYLNKKKLHLDIGDVWKSVWLTIVRLALQRMDKNTIEKRNWQPNIILFSGTADKRPHLLEFGKALVGKYGMLSNFDLIKTDDKSSLFTKNLQSVPSDEFLGKGIFTRRKYCPDIYEGIETIAGTYGFSGIEPNTILMGWARESSNPVRFTKMIQKIAELDVNLILIDYDKRFGYGKYQTIDIWWQSAGNQGNIGITLMKFLWSSEEWQNASLRLLIVNPVNSNAPQIRKQAEETLENLRIDAEIKIINNQIEQKTFYDIIRQESLHADLIILGIPEIEQGREDVFVATTNQLMLDIGTVVLVNASSQFKSLSFGVSNNYIDSEDTISILDSSSGIQELELPDNKIAAENLTELQKQFSELNKEFIEKYFRKIFISTDSLSNEIESEISNFINFKFDEISGNAGNKALKRIVTEIENIVLLSKKHFLEDSVSVVENQFQLLTDGFDYYINKIDEIYLKIPDFSFIVENSENPGKPVKFNVKYKKLVSGFIPANSYMNLIQTAGKFGTVAIENVLVLVNLVRAFRISLSELAEGIKTGSITLEKYQEFQKNISEKLFKINEVEKTSADEVFEYINNITAETLNQISSVIKNPYLKKTGREQKETDKNKRKNFAKISEIPKLWKRNQSVIHDTASLELLLIDFENKLKSYSDLSLHRFSNLTKAITDKNLSKLITELNEYKLQIEKGNIKKFNSGLFETIPSKDTVYFRFLKSIDKFSEKVKLLLSGFPEELSLFTNESYNNLTISQFDELELIKTNPYSLLEMLMKDEFEQEILEFTDKLPEQIIKIESSAGIMGAMLNLNFFDSKGNPLNSSESNKVEIIDFIDNQITKIQALKLELINIEKSLYSKVSERLTTLSDKFTIYSITDLAENLKEYLLKSEAKSRFSFIKNKINSVKNFSENQINRMWYRHSEAILIKEQLQSAGNDSHTDVNDSLSLLHKISISAEVLKEIPVFYQQLFLRKQNFNKEFMFGREREKKLIQQSLENYKSGFYGAIIITGEYNSGKSFLTDYLVSLFSSETKVYSIEPDISGSISIENFNEKLSKTVSIHGNFDFIFSKLNPGSIIVFEDLEMWWEKSLHGSNVIKYIPELIEKYSNKFLFVINMNIHSYKVINNICNLEKIALNIVECKPFNAEQLQEIVLFRHESSGLKLNLNGKQENSINKKDLAKLFAKHFIYSEGNVGITLLSWMSRIKSVKDNTLFIQTPTTIRINIFENLSTDVYILLLQFVLHKRLTVEKLERILLQSKNEIYSNLSYLRRSGIIVNESDPVFKINDVLYIHLINKLKEIEML